jgi:hypothetical protein
MGQKVFHVGKAASPLSEVVLNMMVGLTSAMVGEALTFGKKGRMGWEHDRRRQQQRRRLPLVAYKAQMLKDRNFAPAFTAAQMAKDFDIALETKVNHVAMPGLLMRRFLGSMMAKGAEMASYYLTVLEDLAGIRCGHSRAGARAVAAQLHSQSDGRPLMTGVIFGAFHNVVLILELAVISREPNTRQKRVEPVSCSRIATCRCRWSPRRWRSPSWAPPTCWAAMK